VATIVNCHTRCSAAAAPQSHGGIMGRALMFASAAITRDKNVKHHGPLTRFALCAAAAIRKDQRARQ
jgi:hypothetical protein